jgi:hypothetical protein
MHHAFRRVRTLSGAVLLAMTAMAVHAQNISYNFSHATMASGPAGTIGTGVYIVDTATGNERPMVLVFTPVTTGSGCTMGCGGTPAMTPISGTADGSLKFQLPGMYFGPVTYQYPGQPGRDVSGDGSIIANGSGWGNIYTNLVNPAQTSFAFVFSGHSDTANSDVKVSVTLRDLSSPTLAIVFAQSATTNQAGDWQLVVNSPVSMDLLDKGLYLNIAAASGTNTLSSFLVTPQLVAVPEPGTFSLLGLGLVGLAWTRRQRQH